MVLWVDERKVPNILLRLHEIPNIPPDLRKELSQAIKEVDEDGTVTYPTKARVEYYLNKHQEYISELVKKLEKE